MGKNLTTTITIGGAVSGSLSKAFSSINNLTKNTFSSVNRLNNVGNNIGDSITSKISGIESRLKGLVAAKLISGGISAIKSGGVAMMDQAGKLEQYRNTLNVVMKDSKKAAEAYTWAVNYANKTPYETDEVVDATVKLTSYGMEAQKVLPLTGDMAAAMGKSIDQATEAIADAQTGELERLKEFGITKDMIVEQAGKRLQGIEVVNNKGQITNQRAFNAALFSLMQERYKGAMDIQSKSYNGLKSTITGVMKNTIAGMAGIAQDGSIVEGSAFDYVRQKMGLLADKLQTMQSDGTMEALSQKALQFAQYVGGAIDSAIPKVEFAFNYISTHGSQIEVLIKGIGIAFTTWKTINTISNGINAIKGVHDSILTLKGGLNVLSIAKMKDKAETIQLKALYLQDSATRKAHSASVALQSTKTSILNKLRIKERAHAAATMAVNAKDAVIRKTVSVAQTVQAAKTSLLNKLKLKEKAHALGTMAINAKDAIVRGTVTAATGLQTAAQWALNSAFLACPLTWIIVGIVALVAVFIYLWNNCEGFRTFFINMWNNIKAKLMEVDAWINSAMVTDWTTSFGALGYIVNAAVQFVGSVWNGIKLTIYGVIDFINGVFAGNWSAAWTGIVEIFSGIFSTIESIAKGPINAVIGMVNGAISAVNSLSVSVPDFVPGIGGQTFSPNIPSVPQFANGGIADRPSIFGEAGREMAIPLERNRPRSIRLLNKAADELGVSRKTVGGGNKYIFAPNISANINEETKQYIKSLFDEFVEFIEEKEAEGGRTDIA